MDLIITRFEDTFIPQTKEGREYANAYEKQLKEQGCFNGRKEDTQCIAIKAFHRIVVKEVGFKNGNDD